MAEKIKEDKIILEREYVVPLRRKFANTPQYKRTPKAIKAIKIFIAKHMKVRERDVDNVKIDKYLNLEMWARGIRKPLAKVKVKAKKFDSGKVTVELSEIPQVFKWKIEREKRLSEEAVKEKVEKKEEKKDEKTEEEKKIEEEKKKSEVETSLKEQEKQARELKHVKQTSKEKPKIHRMALKK